MKILKEEMDNNFPTLTKSKTDLKVSISRNVTMGVIDIVQKILDDIQRDDLRAEDLLFTSKSAEYKKVIVATITKIFHSNGIK